MFFLPTGIGSISTLFRWALGVKCMLQFVPYIIITSFPSPSHTDLLLWTPTLATLSHTLNKAKGFHMHPVENSSQKHISQVYIKYLFGIQMTLFSKTNPCWEPSTPQACEWASSEWDAYFNKHADLAQPPHIILTYPILLSSQTHFTRFPFKPIEFKAQYTTSSVPLAAPRGTNWKLLRHV